MTQDEYETELTGGRAEIAAVLSGVVDGLLAGSVRVGDDEDAIAVDIPEELSLEVELETEDDERSLELELEWSVPDDGSDVSPATEVVETLEDEEAEEATADDADGEEATAVLPVGAGDASQSLGRFELYRDRGDEWRWRLRHRNGNVIATSGEGYTRKHNARKGLRSVMQNAPGAEVTED